MFIIIAVLFIASVYIWFDEIVGKPVGPAGVGIGVFILAIMLVAGLITLVVLLKSPRLYFFTKFNKRIQIRYQHLSIRMR